MTDHSDDSFPRSSPSFGELLELRLSRRRVVQGAVALGALPLLAACATASRRSTAPMFQPIAGSKEDKVDLPPNYTHDVVIRWGDGLAADVPDLDMSSVPQGALFAAEAAQRQLRQFGVNCDAIHYFPLDGSRRGILCVNNEYTSDELLFPGRRPVFGTAPEHIREFVAANPGSVAFAKAAHGVSVVEVGRASGSWSHDKSSRYNRRVTADTPMQFGGPAKGARLLCTPADPQGTRVLGTFGNCAGGRTPWGTYLTAEENIQDYFGHYADLRADRNADPVVLDIHRRMRMWHSTSPHGWEYVDQRFDLRKVPNEPLRHGWIVEIDPRDPARTPVKRTALGRFAHEGANPIVARNGRVALYMGDDERFEYVYKFVTRNAFDAKRPEANANLLDGGTLYVARLNADGSGEWLPLVYDPSGPLNESSGFRDQADVVIKARIAGDVLGATPMDRPEDVEPNPVSGRIYVACTNNSGRVSAAKAGVFTGREIDLGPNAANPRGNNRWGHIIELSEQNDDHTGTRFRWEVFLMAGDPAGGKLLTRIDELVPGQVDDRAYFAGFADAAQLSPIGSPDNVGFDTAGNLWITTDGDQPRGTNNGCYACPTDGPDRGHLRQFMSAPIGAEVCGCEFTPDGETLFLSVQHPGEGGTTDKPRSHWPDGPGTLPRASVIAVRKREGGTIGS